MSKLSPPQVELLKRLSAGSIDPVGREFLSGKALVRLGLAYWVPFQDAGAHWISLCITPQGRYRLAHPPEVRGTRRVGIRLPLAVQPHLDRGREIHGTDTAAIVSALKSSYPVQHNA